MDGDDRTIDLTKYVTLKEACKMLGKGPKQTTRYITEYEPPLLEAEKLGKMWYISLESIRKLTNKPVQIEDMLSRRIRLLEGELVKLSREVEQIEARLSALFGRAIDIKVESIQDTLTALIDKKIDKLTNDLNQLIDERTRQIEAQETKKTRHRPVPSSEVGNFVIYVQSLDEIPAGAVLLNAVAGELGINIRSLIEYVMKHQLAHYDYVPNVKRPNEHKRYVTDEQRAAIIASRSRSD